MTTRIHIPLEKGSIINIEVFDDGGGTIESTLKEPDLEPNAQYDAAIDGVESLVLAHACGGVDVTAEAYVDGIRTAVEAIVAHFD